MVGRRRSQRWHSRRPSAAAKTTVEPVAAAAVATDDHGVWRGRRMAARPPASVSRMGQAGGGGVQTGIGGARPARPAPWLCASKAITIPLATLWVAVPADATTEPQTKSGGAAGTGGRGRPYRPGLAGSSAGPTERASRPAARPTADVHPSPSAAVSWSRLTGRWAGRRMGGWRRAWGSGGDSLGGVGVAWPGPPPSPRRQAAAG